MPLPHKKPRPPRPRPGDLWAIPVDTRWCYAWILTKDLLVGYFDVTGDDPKPDLDWVTAAPIAFRLWTSLRSAYDAGWVVIGRRPLPAHLLERPLFFNADPISGRIRATRGEFGDEVDISVEQALDLEEASVWQASHIVQRLRDHFSGFPKKWLESSRLADLGLLPPRFRSSIGPAKNAVVPTPAVRDVSRIWLRRLVENEVFPKRLVRKGQQILASLDERISVDRPVGKAVYKLTHDASRAFNDLAREFEKAGVEIDTDAREEIANDIDYILRKHDYTVNLEEALAPRDW